MRWLPRREVNLESENVAGSLLLALALYVAAGVGMAYVSGFGEVRTRIANAHWWWLAPAFAASVAAFVGYYFAYRGIRRTEGGPELDRGSMLAVVIAGFGGVLAQGGGALDEYAMRAGGAGRREAKVRALALTGFELAALALVVCPASIAAVIIGVRMPRPGFTWPWALIPLPGFVLGAWLAARYRKRLRGRGGWRDKLSTLLDAIHLVVFDIILVPRQCSLAVAGMMLYWGGDMFGLWAATAAFGYKLTALGAIVALGSGMVLTRRTAPLAGAGIMVLALIPTIWYAAGAPLAAATLGVLVYRLLTMWVPVLPGLAALPALRAVNRQAAHSAA